MRRERTTVSEGAKLVHERLTMGQPLTRCAGGWCQGTSIVPPRVADELIHKGLIRPLYKRGHDIRYGLS